MVFQYVLPQTKGHEIEDSFWLDPICVTLCYWHICLRFLFAETKRKQITWLSQVLVPDSHNSFRALATEAFPMRHSLRTQRLIKLLCLMWVSALIEYPFIFFQLCIQFLVSIACMVRSLLLPSHLCLRLKISYMGKSFLFFCQTMMSYLKLKSVVENWKR